MTADPVDFSRLSQHAPGKVALLFSGGKDSLALVELFRPFLDGIVVYHNDTGDLWPETREFVAKVAETVPHFRRIETDAPAWIEANGVPSVLQPFHLSPGVAAVVGDFRRVVLPPWACCAANQWQPIADRLAADAITLVLHGQRDCDYGAAGPPAGARNWHLHPGMDDWWAIRSWTDDQVFAYLKLRGVGVAPFAGGRAPAGPDCATCPAGWANPGRAAYLKQHHPALAAKYGAYLAAHTVDLSPLLRSLQHEIDALQESVVVG